LPAGVSVGLTWVDLDAAPCDFVLFAPVDGAGVAVEVDSSTFAPIRPSADPIAPPVPLAAPPAELAAPPAAPASAAACASPHLPPASHTATVSKTVHEIHAPLPAIGSAFPQFHTVRSLAVFALSRRHLQCSLKRRKALYPAHSIGETGSGSGRASIFLMVISIAWPGLIDNHGCTPLTTNLGADDRADEV
jgi:hypothetical protein